MDLKNEIENELALAILIEKRHVRAIDDNGARELITKIKGALEQNGVEPPTDVGLFPIAEAAGSS